MKPLAAAAESNAPQATVRRTKEVRMFLPSKGLTAKAILAETAALFKLRAGATRATSTYVLRAYAASLALCAAVFAGALAFSGVPLSATGDVFPLILLAPLAAFAERNSIRLSASLEISVAFVPIVFVEVVFGPLAAMLVAGTTILPDLPPLASKPRPTDHAWSRWLVWTSTRVILGASGGLAAMLALSTTGGDKRIIYATAAAAVVSFGINVLLTALTLAVRQTGGVIDVIKAAGPVGAAGIPIYTAVAALLAYAYLDVTPWSAALFFIPALAAQRLFVVSQQQQASLNELREAYATLERANLSFATALVATLDARDRYTAGHSASVATYARDIAAELGLDESTRQLTHLCGLVHDIGKIGLPPGLLEKPGALTARERRLMEEHSAIGERILSNVEGYAEIAQIVRHHHERMDGTGYPDGLSGEAIPLISRILAVADAYDAMTSDRPYRRALPAGVARERLNESVGTQFDSDVVEAFQGVLDEADESYAAGRRAGGPSRGSIRSWRRGRASVQLVQPPYASAHRASAERDEHATSRSLR